MNNVPRSSVVLGIILLAGIIYYVVDERLDSSRESELASKLAHSEQTVKLKDGLYSRAATELSDVRMALDKSAARTSDLLLEAEKSKTELRYATELSLKWKRAFESKHPGIQTVEVPTSAPQECVKTCESIRTTVVLDDQLGPFHLTGHTRTNPAEVVTILEQARPIKITVGLTRADDGKWRTLVAADDKDLQLDIDVSSVDDRLSKKGFLERLSLVVQGAVDGAGLSFAGGIEYQSGRWAAAPLVRWDSAAGAGGGVQVRWTPFEERR